jgi:putative toxin-antitoxin system antitoxin component (TIGR02293 family)
MEKDINKYNINNQHGDIASEPAAVYYARSGMSPSIFVDLMFFSGFSKEELAPYFNTSSKTIHRYLSSGKPLDAFTSEHALGIKSLYIQGSEVFENVENFRQWLKKANYGLGNMIPQELMKTPGGLRLVKEELMRIEFGATA